MPKALNDQGFALSASLGLTSIVYASSFFGKAFTGFLMEIIGRRWTIAYELTGSLPGLALMLLSHRAGNYADVMMVAGGMIIGFTVLSAFTATRVYLSEQFPTALRGRGHIFGESFGRLFAGGFAPFLMEPHTRSAPIFFGTIFVVVAIGAFIPLVFGRETVGQLETVTEGCRHWSEAGRSTSRKCARLAVRHHRLAMLGRKLDRSVQPLPHDADRGALARRLRRRLRPP